MGETSRAEQLEVERFKALGNPERLRIYKLLRLRPMTVNALVEKSGLPQPTVSTHLRTLSRIACLCVAEREGREVTYAAIEWVFVL